MTELDLVTIALLGLTGSVHCTGMCGGFVASYSMLSDARSNSNISESVHGNILRPISKIIDHLLFNLGRIVTYTALGTIAGALGEAAFRGLELAGLQNLLAIISGILIILSGLVLLGIIPGRVAIESAFGGSNSFPFVWLRRLLRSASPFKTLPLGLVVGLLPCPLVYSALLIATARGNWVSGAIVMFLFGLGTIPIMLAIGVISRAVSVRLKSRIFQIAAVIIILVGALTVYRGLGKPCHSGHPPAENHSDEHHGAMNESPITNHQSRMTNEPVTNRP